MFCYVSCFQLGELYESIRWPATLGFLTILLLLCTVLVIGVARRSRCALIFFSVAGLFCIIICWLLAGVYLASSVAAGDFCMRPHEYMCRQVGMVSIELLFYICILNTLRKFILINFLDSIIDQKLVFPILENSWSLYYNNSLNSEVAI